MLTALAVSFLRILPHQVPLNSSVLILRHGEASRSLDGVTPTPVGKNVLVV